jgi:hypothetical protein
MKIYYLIIFTLILTTFSRVFEVILGLPAIINLLHFPLVLLIFILTLNKISNKKNTLILGIIILFVTILFSGFINAAGIINVFLEFLLFAEPFLLLIIIVNIDYSKESIHKLGKWIIFFGLIQIPFAFYQYIAWDGTHLRSDIVKGTFLGMGAGHHVMGAIAIICAIYLLYSFNTKPYWLKYIFALSLFSLPILSDAKQAILAFLVSYVLLSFTKIKNPKKFIKYALITLLFIIITFKIISIFFSGSYWAQEGVIISGLKDKFDMFSVLNSNHKSFIGWVFGLGPGHTAGRLAFMLPEYFGLLIPYGATISPITNQIWQSGHYSAKQSSLFNPFFSWAGVLGDIGIIGFLVYICLLWILYHKYCKDDISKIFLMSIFVFGWIFVWLEEPNFMLYIVAVIGQRWLAFGIKEKVQYKKKRIEKFIDKWLGFVLKSKTRRQ